MRYLGPISQKLTLSETVFEVFCNLPAVLWNPDKFLPVLWVPADWEKCLRSPTGQFLSMNNLRPILKLPIFADFVWGSAIFQSCVELFSTKEGANAASDHSAA